MDPHFHVPGYYPPPPALAPALPPDPGPVEPDPVTTYSFNTGLMVFLMVLWSSLGHKLASKTKYMGDGSVACALGLVTGVLLLMGSRYLDQAALRQLLEMNPADFFLYFLPPIIFYAGLSVKKKRFFRNFGSIAAFGILGTYMLFAIIAFFLFALSKLPNILTLADCLALGAIFAATDSVAVLQVIRPETHPLLYSLVFGEGVMNDATSVAMLRAVQEYVHASPEVATSLTGILFKFLYLFIASVALGVLFGLGTAFLLKLLNSRSTPQEVSLIGMLAYLSYLCGELLGISGIVTLFCCGVVISHYALHNVAPMSRVTTVSAFQTLSYLSEGGIFIYVGMDTLDPSKWANTYILEVVWLFVVLLVLLLVGRAVVVIAMTAAHNWWSQEKLTHRDMVIIWWGGLMRGAVSVALIYRYFDPKGQTVDPARSTLITTTLLLVLFSTMVFGALTKPLMDFIQGPEGSPLASTMELISGRYRGFRGPRRPHDYAVVNMHSTDEAPPPSGGFPGSHAVPTLGRDVSFPSFGELSDLEEDSHSPYGSGSDPEDGARAPAAAGLRRQGAAAPQPHSPGLQPPFPPSPPHTTSTVTLDYLGAPRTPAAQSSPYAAPKPIPPLPPPPHSRGSHPSDAPRPQGALSGPRRWAGSRREAGAPTAPFVPFPQQQPQAVMQSPFRAAAAAHAAGNSTAVAANAASPLANTVLSPATQAAAQSPGLVPFDGGTAAGGAGAGPGTSAEEESEATLLLGTRATSVDDASALSQLWRSFDQRYMQPIFGGPAEGAQAAEGIEMTAEQAASGGAPHAQ